MAAIELVQVWLARVDDGRLDDEVRSGLAADLDAATLTRLDRFRRPEDRDRGLAAHAVLRRLIGPALGRRPRDLVLATWCRACDSHEHGKPFVDGFGPVPPVEFNLSHSGGLVAVALAPAGVEVGVDVERRDRKVDWTALRRSIFTDAEWAASAAAVDPASARTTLWSCKEAVVKALGQGLATPLRRVLIDVPPGDRDADPTGWAATVAPPADRAGDPPAETLIGWDVADAAGVAERYAAAVAIRAGDDAGRMGEPAQRGRRPEVGHVTL